MRDQEAVERAFLQAYEELGDAIFRHCFFRVHERELARDLTQETFTRTWDYLAKGNRVDNLRPFLYRVATNLIIDYSRKKRPQVSLEEMRESGFEPQILEKQHWENSIDSQEAIACLSRLDEKYRLAVELRYIEGYGPKEIAEILNESENVISVRINRGIKMLRNLMNREQDE